ncbi:MAG TPA: glycosyltransferase family 4 protein [Bryobacteraceae bacterium]|nr:glycosyltransferase family 4 protein [Bryobacteraceae bacterium]
MTVLLVGNFLSAAVGNRGVCEDLAERLRAAGWDVLTTSSRLARIPRLADMLSTVWRRRGEYEAAHVDVYSGLGFRWAEAVAWTLRRAGKPYLLTLHGGALPEFARRHGRRVRRLLESATAVTAPSAFLAEELRPFRPDLRLIPNALDVARYPFRLRNAPQPRLVWVRAFHEVYDPGLAVRALAKIRGRQPEATLRMAGPDKGDGSLQRAMAAARELGVQESVSFAGAIPKAAVPAWIAEGDIFLNTTTVDNTPVSVMEAMACGACVVSTNAGGMPHLVRDGEDGLLVPPRDAGAMAAAVERLLAEPALARRISFSARRRAEAWDWAAVLPQWEQLFASAGRLRAVPTGVYA